LKIQDWAFMAIDTATVFPEGKERIVDVKKDA